MDQYFIIRNGNQFGPYDPQQLLSYVNSGHILLYDVAYGQFSGRKTTVKEVLKLEHLKPKVATEGNFLQQIKKIGSDLIFPHSEVLNRQWFSDKRFVMLAIVGLVPLFISYFSLGAELLTFYFIALYFSVLWGLIFYYFFRTHQVTLRTTITTFFLTQIGVFLIFDWTHIAYLNPFYFFCDSPFPIDMIGYIFGVGINEEVVKLLPLVIISYRAKEPLLPQTLVFYGLISGIAFGVYEGVEYQLQVNNQFDYTSAHYLNILRLTSLPFIHAVWCGIAGYFLSFARLYPRYRYALYFLMVAVPAVLHGLYDTFVSTGVFFMDFVGLAITVVSVILLMLYLRKSVNYQSKLRN